MSELQLTDDSKTPDFEKILNQKKMTNAQTAEVMRVIVRRFAELNKNQLSLQAQHQELGKRMDRLERLILDQREPGGGVRAGLAKSLQATQQELADVNGRLSEVFLSTQALSRVLPWAVKNPEATEEELAGVFAAIRADLIKEGEEAAAAWPVAREIAEKLYRCGGCKYWKHAPAVQVPGQEVVAGCTQKAVQVKCPRCGHLHGAPVDPNNVTGECVKCKTKLTREIELPDDQGKRTMCGTFRSDPHIVREKLAEAGISETVIAQLVPQSA